MHWPIIAIFVQPCFFFPDTNNFYYGSVQKTKSYDLNPIVYIAAGIYSDAKHLSKFPAGVWRSGGETSNILNLDRPLNQTV